MLKNQILYLILSISFVNTSCSSKVQNSSDLTIAGGVEDNTSYPGVVGLLIEHTAQFKHFCTGTIVRDDLILTAAHCLSDHQHLNILKFANYVKEGRIEGLLKNSVKPINYIKHPSSRFLNPREDLSPYLKADVAFIVYPKGTFDQNLVTPLAKESVQVGEEVHLVGYGYTGPDKKDANPDGIRRTGMNIVYHIFGDYKAKAIMLKRREHVPSSALGFFGDSGGPLISNSGKVVGVLSYGSGAHDAYYVNITNNPLRSFIDMVMKGPQSSPQMGHCPNNNPKKTAPGIEPETCPSLAPNE